MESRLCLRTVVMVFVVAAISSVQAQGIGTVAESDGTVAPETSIKVFSLQHASAKEVQRIVGELLDLSKGRDPRQAFFRGSRGNATRTRTSADPRTNLFLVSGTGGDLQVIETLVQRLDTPAATRATDVENAANANLTQRIERLEKELEQLKSRLRGQPARSAAGGGSRSRPPVRSQQQGVETTQVEGTAIHCEVLAGKSGTVRALWIAPEGKRVKKGDLLVEFDATSLEQSLHEQKIKLNAAQAWLQRNRASHERAVLGAKSQIADAEQAVQSAELALLSYQNGARVIEAKQLEVEVQKSQASLERLQELSVGGLASKTSIEQAKIEFELAELKYRTGDVANSCHRHI